ACGGVILIGVTDGGTVKGLDLGKKTTVDLAEYIKKNTDPGIFPEIEVHDVRGMKIISVSVKESHDKPVFFRGRAYKRVGDTSQKINSSEIRALAKVSVPKVYWDGQVCEGAALSDIDNEKLTWFLKKAKSERKMDINEQTSAKEALEKLGLFHNNKLTNAAVLLFGKDAQRHFLQAEVRCAKFKGIEAVKPFLDMRVLRGNIYRQIDAGERFILDNIKKQAWVEPGKIERQEKWEYPPDAIREAITNAICHRDYAMSSNAYISIFDDRIEIWNPGRVPEPLTLEDLKIPHKSVPVNPLLAEMLYLVKYIERWGSGTVDLVKWCLQQGLPEPMFKEHQGGFLVILRKYRISDEVIKTLNERQKKSVGYLMKHGKITSRDYQKLCPDVSRETLRKDMNELIEKEIIFLKGAKRGIYYELA
ncbi:MAG: putative DNA binding domain-containing protein, partial [Thermodesulfovibrionia bacterium]|nr:putative DNA binding domain-containing protein [Thermodesulfovibrionia bacterium]